MSAAQGLTLASPLGPFPPLVLRLLRGVLLPRFSSPRAWAAVGWTEGTSQPSTGILTGPAFFPSC